MAVKPVTRKYTLTGAPIQLAAILGRAGNTWMGSLALRAARTNSEDVYWQDEDGQQGGYIGPGEAVSMDFGEGQALMQNIAVLGKLNDIVFITAGLNRHYFEPGE